MSSSRPHGTASGWTCSRAAGTKLKSWGFKSTCGIKAYQHTAKVGVWPPGNKGIHDRLDLSSMMSTHSICAASANWLVALGVVAATPHTLLTRCMHARSCMPLSLMLNAWRLQGSSKQCSPHTGRSLPHNQTGHSSIGPQSAHNPRFQKWCEQSSRACPFGHHPRCHGQKA